MGIQCSLGTLEAYELVKQVQELGVSWSGMDRGGFPWQGRWVGWSQS